MAAWISIASITVVGLFCASFVFDIFVPFTWLSSSIYTPMAEIRTVTTLRSKRTEIIASIANYEKKLAQARADPAT